MSTQLGHKCTSGRPARALFAPRPPTNHLPRRLLVLLCFFGAGTASRIGGVSVEQLAADQLTLHAMAYGLPSTVDRMLPDPGEFHFR